MPKSAYSLPEVYEVAFSFRDYYKAVEFLIEAAARAGLTDITSVVELGCGPAQYAREFARRGITAYGVDYSSEMVVHARERCQHDALTCNIIEADMRDFQLPQPVDLAVCMMATFHCLLTNDDILSHLRSVANNLSDHGLYIVELEHPRDVFAAGESTQNVWEMDDRGLKVKTDWCSDAVIDPLTEVDTGTVIYTVTQGEAVETFSFRESLRKMTSGLVQALIALSGSFEIVKTYGDLDLERPFDNDQKAWRMVLVLRKK